MFRRKYLPILCAMPLFVAGLFSQPAVVGQKPTKIVKIHTDGGLGTPATLDGLWRQSDVVALIEVSQVTPDNRTYSTTDGTIVTLPKTLYASNVIELFKSVAIPVALDIEAIGGKVDRGDHFEEEVNEQMPPLQVGGRYIAFLRNTPKQPTYLPATDDASSFYRVDGTSVTTDGKSELARTLAGMTTDELLGALRRLRKGR
jgi:hypothetical protein